MPCSETSLRLHYVPPTWVGTQDGDFIRHHHLGGKHIIVTRQIKCHIRPCGIKRNFVGNGGILFALSVTYQNQIYLQQLIMASNQMAQTNP